MSATTDNPIAASGRFALWVALRKPVDAVPKAANPP